MYLPGLLCTCQAYTYTCQAFASGLPARFTICLSGLLLLLYLELFKQHTQTWPSWPGMAKSLTPPTIPRQPSYDPLTHTTTAKRALTMLCLSVSGCFSEQATYSCAFAGRAMRHVSDSAERPISHPTPLTKCLPHTHEVFERRYSARRCNHSALLTSTTSSNTVSAHTEHRQATHLNIRTRRHAIVYIQLSAFTHAGKMRWGR